MGVVELNLEFFFKDPILVVHDDGDELDGLLGLQIVELDGPLGLQILGIEIGIFFSP